eukprot:CAMPEP_0114558836 /NCGR_PEP_ID=MMETSP0114-20121206/10599_1 /TAXON_ID=31324 /ORGANISM="Goniomonas sp, Strain m" /LENGTH=257 /DNA_ID=CAMNT_0001744263 /DNA_START=54 /DNA_END=827 /DNA_ORIENTATION=+
MSSRPINKAAEAQKEKGNEEFKKGNHGAAIEAYTFATEMDPQNPTYFSNRATCYLKLEQHAKALRDVDKAIALEPVWDKAHWRRATILAAMGDNTGAVDAYAKAASLAPSNATYKQDLEKARRLLPQGDLYKSEGNDLFKAGKFKEAAVKYTKALEYCKADDAALKCSLLSNLAACYSQQQCQDLDKVIQCTTQCLELDPCHVKALIRRAQSYETLEKYEKSMDDWQKAYSLAGAGTPAISQGLNRVRNAIRQTKGQ